MTFINTAYAALRLVVSAIAGFVPAMLRDLGTIGAALGGGTARPSSQVAMRAAVRPAAFVVVVLLVYPALRNVYVMEFIDNPRTAHENAEKAAADAQSAAIDADVKKCLNGGCNIDLFADDKVFEEADKKKRKLFEALRRCDQEVGEIKERCRDLAAAKWRGDDE